MSFMEEQVLGYKSPLYGRRTAQFKIHLFTFFESRQMLTSFSPEQQAILYGVTGGIPEYLSRVDQKLNMDENIIRLFFEESGRLFEEPVTSRKTLYHLADSMFLFWYRFVRPNVSSIIRGVGKQVYQTLVLPQLNDLMSVLDKKALFCECKWRKEKVGSDVLEILMERGELFAYPNKYYYIFSKSGFDDAITLSTNANANVKMIGFRDMCSYEVLKEK